MARHKWGEPDAKGNVTCSICGLCVPEWRKQRGGLGECVPGKWQRPTLDQYPVTYPSWLESPLVTCKACNEKVPNTRFCLYCGAPIQGVYGGYPTRMQRSLANLLTPA